MREHKYRAWDKIEKCFLKDNDVNFILHPYEPGTIYRAGSYCNCCDEWVWGSEEEPTDDLEIIEYAGLKDKNNDDIYENYIIENTINKNWYVVLFENGRYYGKFLPHDNICGGYQIDTLHKLDFNFIRIVGNIYENPELLKK